MEMSPRQMWMRFVMIINKWNEEQLVEQVIVFNGISKDFDWLNLFKHFSSKKTYTNASSET